MLIIIFIKFWIQILMFQIIITNMYVDTFVILVWAKFANVFLIENLCDCEKIVALIWTPSENNAVNVNLAA